jgi:hypothetical protein
MQRGEREILAAKRSTSKLWQSDGNTTKGLPDSRNNGTSLASTNGTIWPLNLSFSVLCIVGWCVPTATDTKSWLPSQNFATRISTVTGIRHNGQRIENDCNRFRSMRCCRLHAYLWLSQLVCDRTMAHSLSTNRLVNAEA